MNEHPETQYLNLLKDIIENGAVKDDRTGVGTKSVFGTTLRFDLSKEFPLLTTKKVFFKGIVHELLWFLSGNTNIKYLVDNGVNIWNEWADKNGNLGPVYGKQWRGWESISFVEPQIKSPPQPKKAPAELNLIYDYSNNKHNLIGKRFKSKNYGDFVVIREFTTDGKTPRLKFEVVFIDTGYTCITEKHHVITGNLLDKLAPSVEGVGSMGLNEVSKEDKVLLKGTWASMLIRCYKKSEPSYKYYGKKGVFVDDRWLRFDNFVEDVKTLKNWKLKKLFPDKYSLDKDISGSNYYSKETCRWASFEEQSRNKKTSIIIKVTDPSGKEFLSFGIRDLCKKFNFNVGLVSDCVNGNRKSYKGYTFQKINVQGKIPIIEITDQIRTLIAEIILNSDSRRMVLTAWNVNQLEQMNLPPCHLMSFFSVYGNKLNCLFSMRSTDVLLGLPFNLASYALLTIMLAQVTGLIPGELVFSGADTHLYLNHLEQASEQVKRIPYPFPTLRLNKDIKDIDDFKFEDIILENYQHHPSIKAPIAV